MCPIASKSASDELGVVRRARDQLARSDPVVVAGIELESAAEDRVADVRVGERAVADREVVAAPAGHRLDGTERHEARRRTTRARERLAATIPESTACRISERRQRSRRPARRGRRRPRLRSSSAGASRSCRGSANPGPSGHYSVVSNARTPIEERFPAPSVMGVINVTPDSFSDGGVHLRVEAAVTAAWGMLDCGAAIVDVGGESTRPGSDGVTAAEELERIEQVLLDLDGRAGLGRHLEGGGRPSRARARRRARQRRDRAARRSRARRRRRRRGLLSLPHAHAGRAAHDADRPHATTTSSRT